ncbi:MAG: BatD family protein [Spirochaetales bacterium]|nr:BatD family protein [Spirochaetales bacterium]
MHKLKFSILIFLFLANFVYAKNISYNLDSSTNEVSTNEMFQITLEIFNAGNASVSLLEQNPAVTLREAGKSTSFSFTNGQQSSSVTITYIAKATKEGKQKIGPFRIKNRSESIDTNPLFITVSKSSSNNSNAANQENREAFIKTVASKTSVYEGEFIDISVLFYTSVETKINDYTQLEFPADAWTEDIRSENEHKRRLQIGNRIFDEYEIERKRLFINTAGEYTISSAKINLYLFSRSDIFSFYSTPVFLETEPVNITVKPLPESVIDINGTVPTGNFTADVKLSSTEVKVGEPVTMIITLNGNGNFHVINKFPTSHTKEIEVFTSKSNAIKNANVTICKNWETILVPKKQGNFTISAGPFTYFDTSSYEYKTLPEQTFNINIIGNDNETQLMQTVDFNNNENGRKQKVKVIDPKSLFMISNVLEKHPINHSNISFILLMIVMYCLFIFFLVGYFIFKFSLKKDSKKANPLKRLEKEINKIDTGNLSKATEKIYGEMEVFIINEFEIDSVDIRKNILKEKLSDKLSEELLEQLIDIISEFEIIRFGGMDVSLSGINTLKCRVLELCKNLVKYKDSK